MASQRSFVTSSILLLALVFGLGLFASLNWPRRGLEMSPKERQVLRSSLGQPLGASQEFATVAKLVMPSVVGITVTRYTGGGEPAPEGVRKRFPHLPERLEKFHPWGTRPPSLPQDTAGSGVIVEVEDTSALILTNDHVVRGYHEISVSLSDHREFEGRFIASDAKSDLALLQIEGRELEAAQMGDSEELQVGEWVLAIGNPFGLSHTVTAGIVSAKGRSDVHLISSKFAYENFIQTDAAINPGNSGGPLVNLRAEVVGINTAIASVTGGYQGVGFAIPINQARRIYRRLMKDGRVSRGWLGVDIDKLRPEQAQVLGISHRDGVLIRGIRMGTPAAKAGLRQGDVILKFNEQGVHTVEELRYAVADAPVGSEMEVMVLRGGDTLALRVHIGEQPADDREALPPLVPEEGDLGMKVRDLTPELAKEKGYEGQEGALVTDVQETGRAGRAGIRTGSLIQWVHQGPERQFQIRSVEDYRQALGKINPREPLGVTVRDGDQTVELITVE
ncbi:MAG: Do family serine endopeptidase [Planctomycetes bacterium]|nr:Do family serine endopeptidase [Planctomycetota bacterium]